MAEDIAIVAGGCFWCTEAVFLDIAGVTEVVSGYVGGHSPNPSYREVCGGHTGHAEAVRIAFDPTLVSYGDLLDIFFATHDPTQLNRQGNDVGTQYRSAIFPLSSDQRREAEAAIERARSDHQRPVVTTIEEVSDWYPAEDYHQDYWSREGRSNPYCLATIPPKLAKLRKSFQQRLKASAGDS